jgi:predicted alpha/beta hydrolase
MSETPEHVTIPTTGGTLAASYFRPIHAPTAIVIISSGTGYKRAFYRHFAQFCVENGAAAIAYDYRGIGARPDSPLLQTMDISDWAQDLDAVIRWADASHPGVPILHVGHSVGGHLVALSAQARRVHQHLLVASGSGTFWHHFKSRWPLELYFWWILGPYSLLRWGFLNRVGGWTGSAVPGPAFRTWRRWSHRRRYFAEAVKAWRQRQDPSPAKAPIEKVPIESWVFADDGICTPLAARTILANFDPAQIQMRVVAPKDYGWSSIGHDGAFRAGKEALWRDWWASLRHGIEREPHRGPC